MTTVLAGYRVPIFGDPVWEPNGNPRHKTNPWVPPVLIGDERFDVLQQIEATCEYLHMLGETEIDPNAIQVVAIALPLRERKRLAKAGPNIAGIIKACFDLMEVTS